MGRLLGKGSRDDPILMILEMLLELLLGIRLLQLILELRLGMRPVVQLQLGQE